VKGEVRGEGVGEGEGEGVGRGWREWVSNCSALLII